MSRRLRVGLRNLNYGRAHLYRVISVTCSNTETEKGGWGCSTSLDTAISPTRSNLYALSTYSVDSQQQYPYWSHQHYYYDYYYFTRALDFYGPFWGGLFYFTYSSVSFLGLITSYRSVLYNYSRTGIHKQHPGHRHLWMGTRTHRTRHGKAQKAAIQSSAANNRSLPRSQTRNPGEHSINQPKADVTQNS